MKKRNFLGGMQNYNEKTGEYEPSLVGKNGKVVKDADGDGKVNEGKKKPLKLEKGATVRVAKEYGDNTREFEIVDVKDELKGITIKEKGRDGITYQVDKSQLEGYEPNNYKDSPYGSRWNEEHDFNDPKEAEGNFKQEKDFNDPKALFETGAKDSKFGNLSKDKLVEKVDNLDFGDIIFGYNDEGKTININEYDPEKDKFIGYDGDMKTVELSYDEMVNLKRFGKEPKTEQKPTEFKLDKQKYPDVEETPYGFIYNVNGQSITDHNKMNKQLHEKNPNYPYDPNKDYGWSYTVGGDEVYAESFEDAYKSVKSPHAVYPEKINWKDLSKKIKTPEDVRNVFGKYLTEDDKNKLDKAKTLYVGISKQYDGDDNFILIDDERIKQAHNFGYGSEKDFINYMENNKEGMNFIKVR